MSHPGQSREKLLYTVKEERPEGRERELGEDVPDVLDRTSTRRPRFGGIHIGIAEVPDWGTVGATGDV